MVKAGIFALVGLATVSTSAYAQGEGVAAKVEALGRVNSAVSPSLSPDGRRLAYLSNVSGSPQIWVRDLRTNFALQLTNLPDPVGSVFWSPNAARLAYTVAPGGGLNTQIWVMNADGSGAKQLTPGGKENNGLAGWTRDGAELSAGRLWCGADHFSGQAHSLAVHDHQPEVAQGAGRGNADFRRLEFTHRSIRLRYSLGVLGASSRRPG